MLFLPLFRPPENPGFRTPEKPPGPENPENPEIQNPFMGGFAIYLSRLGELLNTPKNVHFFAPRGDPRKSRPGRAPRALLGPRIGPSGTLKIGRFWGSGSPDLGPQGGVPRGGPSRPDGQARTGRAQQHRVPSRRPRATPSGDSGPSLARVQLAYDRLLLLLLSTYHDDD